MSCRRIEVGTYGSGFRIDSAKIVESFLDLRKIFDPNLGMQQGGAKAGIGRCLAESQNKFVQRQTDQISQTSGIQGLRQFTRNHHQIVDRTVDDDFFAVAVKDDASRGIGVDSSDGILLR